MATNDDMNDGIKNESESGIVLYDSSWIAGVDYNDEVEENNNEEIDEMSANNNEEDDDNH
jgi:hypothetical protein